MCWGEAGGRESQEAECAGWPRALRNRELQYSQSNDWSREPTELVHHNRRQSAAWLKFDMVGYIARQSQWGGGGEGGISLVQITVFQPAFPALPWGRCEGVGGGQPPVELLQYIKNCLLYIKQNYTISCSDFKTWGNALWAVGHSTL